MGKSRVQTSTTADELENELQAVALSLKCAYDRFNHVTDPELVDSSIYEINSLQARYNYLLRRIKALHGGAPVEAPRARPVPQIRQEVACAAAAMEGGQACPS